MLSTKRLKTMFSRTYLRESQFPAGLTPHLLAGPLPITTHHLGATQSRLSRQRSSDPAYRNQVYLQDFNRGLPSGHPYSSGVDRANLPGTPPFTLLSQQQKTERWAYKLSINPVVQGQQRLQEILEREYARDPQVSEGERAQAIDAETGLKPDYIRRWFIERRKLSPGTTYSLGKYVTSNAPTPEGRFGARFGLPVSADDTNVTITVGENTCTIALQGATVHSYIHKGVERLFHSTKSPLEGPTAIRGGIPICWPIFGPPDAKDERFNKLKQHGFARTTKWEYDESESADTKEGGAKAVFKLKSTPETEAIYGPAFFLAYTVTLTPDSLVVSLYVLNPSTTDPLPFQALFHAYLRLPPTILPPAVTAIGLEGLPFVDKVQGGAKGLEQRTVITVDGPKGEVDRVYFGAPDALGLSWEGGEVKVTKTGLADVVLWNPGPEKGATIGDMEEGGANRYVCLEPGQVGTLVELKALETWEGSVELAFE